MDKSWHQRGPSRKGRVNRGELAAASGGPAPLHCARPGHKGDPSRPQQYRDEQQRSDDHGTSPARRVDCLQQDHHHHRSRVRHADGVALPVGHRAAVQRLVRQPASAVADHLPARQSLLGLPVVRDRDLPRPRPGSWRALCLADPPLVLTAVRGGCVADSPVPVRGSRRV